MLTALIIVLLALAATAFAIHRKQRIPRHGELECQLPPARFRGLFSHASSDADGEASGDAGLDLIASERRAALVQRATQGDLLTLGEAHDGDDRALYAEVLDALLAWTSDSRENFRLLVSQIATSKQLRASPQLAGRLIEATRRSPDRHSTAEMLHIAALSDDAATYQEAVDLALFFWREGRAPDWTAQDLHRLVESEYWVISPEVRRSGAGFALRRRLAGVRRELAAATPAP